MENTQKKTYEALEIELLNVLNSRNWKGQAKSKAETFGDLVTELKTLYGLEISTEFLIQLCETSGMERARASEKITDFCRKQGLNYGQETIVSYPVRQRTGHVYGEENGVSGFNLSNHESVKTLHFF